MENVRGQVMLQRVVNLLITYFFSGGALTFEEIILRSVTICVNLIYESMRQIIDTGDVLVRH